MSRKAAVRVFHLTADGVCEARWTRDKAGTNENCSDLAASQACDAAPRSWNRTVSRSPSGLGTLFEPRAKMRGGLGALVLFLGAVRLSVRVSVCACQSITQLENRSLAGGGKAQTKWLIATFHPRSNPNGSEGAAILREQASNQASQRQGKGREGKGSKQSCMRRRRCSRWNAIDKEEK